MTVSFNIYITFLTLLCNHAFDDVSYNSYYVQGAFFLSAVSLRFLSFSLRDFEVVEHSFLNFHDSVDVVAIFLNLNKA